MIYEVTPSHVESGRDKDSASNPLSEKNRYHTFCGRESDGIVDGCYDYCENRVLQTKVLELFSDKRRVIFVQAEGPVMLRYPVKDYDHAPRLAR